MVPYLSLRTAGNCTSIYLIWMHLLIVTKKQWFKEGRDRLNCSLCGMPSTQFDLNKKQHVITKHPKEVTGIICSGCIQVILASSQEKIKSAYQKALDAELLDKAKALESFIEEGEKSVRETKNLKRDMVRTRPLRTFRPSRDQIRAQQAAL